VKRSHDLRRLFKDQGDCLIKRPVLGLAPVVEIGRRVRLIEPARLFLAPLIS
jgi:hypothetical protein